MIKLDNNKIEKKIINLFIQSLSFKHEYYKTTHRKLNLFAELYIHTHFFYFITYKKWEGKSVEKLSSYIDTLMEYDVVKSNNIDYIRNISKKLSDITDYDRINMSIKMKNKYSNKQDSIIRKMKISMVLL